MTIDIDITDKQSREIIDILDNYPNGHLEIKFERVFWCSNNIEPLNPRYNPGEHPLGGPPHAPNKGGNAGRVTQSMADVLGSMVCPPPRQQPPQQYRKR